MRKIIVFLSAGLLLLLPLSAAPSARAAVSLNADRLVVDFIETLKKKDYAAAYDLFSERFKKEISLPQHVGLLEILQEELGDIEDYESVVMPFLTSSAKEGEVLSDLPPSDIKRYTYDLKYEKRTVHAIISLVKESDGYRIGFFEITGTGFETDPQVQEKVRALGL